MKYIKHSSAANIFLVLCTTPSPVAFMRKNHRLGAAPLAVVATPFNPVAAQ